MKPPVSVARSSDMLTTHNQHLAGTYFRQNLTNLGHQWSKVDEPVASSYHRNDPDAKSLKVLLEAHFAIHREKDVEPRAAARRRAPFSKPAQPSSWVVRTM